MATLGFAIAFGVAIFLRKMKYGLYHTTSQNPHFPREGSLADGFENIDLTIHPPAEDAADHAPNTTENRREKIVTFAHNWGRDRHLTYRTQMPIVSSLFRGGAYNVTAYHNKIVCISGEIKEFNSC